MLISTFVSNTFNDIQVERDYLVKQVFPDLRELCGKWNCG
jgi:hypothetical protein